MLDKVYWKARIQTKNGITEREVYTIGDHETIARDKVLEHLSDADLPATIIEITQVKIEKKDIENPFGD